MQLIVNMQCNPKGASLPQQVVEAFSVYAPKAYDAFAPLQMLRYAQVLLHQM